MLRIFILWLFFFAPILCLAQKGKAKSVDPISNTLIQAGKNRFELEKAIRYFEKQDEPLKLKAINFLIANMDIHYSVDYYWADSTGRRISYNELDYADFSSGLNAFENLKKKTGKVKPVPYRYRDIDTIRAEFLINNVELAFSKWRAGPFRGLSFEEFCEDILPYRVSTEPLQQWRTAYIKKFDWMVDSAKNTNVEGLLRYVGEDFKTWFINTWDTEKRSDPLPRLGPLQLLSRKKGNCDDIGDLEVYTLRSQGFPARLEHIPFWATTTGRHYFNSTMNENHKNLPFDISTASVKIDNFSREPSKVVRITYSKQRSTLINILPSKDIPEGFLRMPNYVDVTDKYWETVSVKMRLFRLLKPQKVAFACVFNGFKWQPTWWGKISSDSIIFNNMCRGAVFLPMYYIDNKLIPAGYPMAYGYKNTKVLKPDVTNRQTVKLKEERKFLIYRPGKKYKLYYWENGWRVISERIALEGEVEMIFSNVPRSALLLLIPEYSQGKERPFILTDNGDRVWF